METCRVCGWIDELQQLVHPDFIVGANAGVSLREAQRRAPVAQPRSADWRPLRDGEHPQGEFASPACALGVPEREGFVPYWKRR